MNNILKSAKRLIKEMEEDNKREVTLYKMIKKYYDDFGTERGDKLLTVIKKNLSHLNAPKQVSDVGVPQYPVSEMMMGPDESVDNIGDSIMNSDLSNMAIKTTYADDFDNFDDYFNEILNKLTSEYSSDPIYDELREYLYDVYSEYFLELFLMGQDDSDEGEILIP